VRKLVIVIDGPAGAGKSTASRQLARALGGTYLDTGAMYRAITLKALRLGIDLADGAARARVAEQASVDLRPDEGERCRVALDGEDVTEAIRTREVTNAIHWLAGDGRVRDVLVALQRRFAKDVDRTVVAEGRDLASVVFPDADVKIYLDASVEERARRRQKDLGADAPPFATLVDEIATRDHRDSTRAVAPLVRVPDAIHVDSSALGPDEVVAKLREVVREATGV
jgi:CMP/dCMP kinase